MPVGEQQQTKGQQRGQGWNPGWLGEHQDPGGRQWEIGRDNRAAYDQATWTRLWEVSDKMVSRWAQRERQQAKADI